MKRLRTLGEILMGLLRELSDEAAYRRHLAATADCTSRGRVAALLGRAPARKIHATEVLLESPRRLLHGLWPRRALLPGVPVREARS